MSRWMDWWLAFLLAGGFTWLKLSVTEKGWKWMRPVAALLGSWLILQVVTTLIEHYMEVPK